MATVDTPARSIASYADPLEILLEQDLWGTCLIIDSAAPLTGEQFRTEFPMGFGTLQKTLAHMASAVYRWGDVLGGNMPRAPLEWANFPTPASFVPAFEESNALLRVQAAARPLGEIVERETNGRVYRFTRAAALMQITTHGTYHRAQCVNMLRHLGVVPVPDPSVMKWMMAMEPR